MIKKVSRKDLNLEKYTECLNNSVNYRIYAEYWYLDALVGSHWDCYVLNDYEAIMPIPYSKKIGIKIITQPTYCQQLGVFHQNELHKYIFQLFEKKLHRNLVRSYHFNEENTEMFKPKGEKRVNQVLDISFSFKTIFDQTYKDRKKDFKRNNAQEFKIVRETNINKFIEILISNHSFTDKLDLNYFRNFLNNGHVPKKLTQFSLLTIDNKVSCSALLLQSQERVILLSSARDKKIETKGSFAFLIYKIIEHFSGNQYILDFEGSSLKGVQEFNNSFKAIKKYYTVYKSLL